MGSVDSGIHAMCWSPDQDLVVLVTGEFQKSIGITMSIKIKINIVVRR